MSIKVSHASMFVVKTALFIERQERLPSNSADHFDSEFQPQSRRTTEAMERHNLEGLDVLPLPDITDFQELDYDLLELELGSDGSSSPLASPSCFSGSGSFCSSPRSPLSPVSQSTSGPSSPELPLSSLPILTTIKSEPSGQTVSSCKKRQRSRKGTRKPTQRSGASKFKRNERERRRVKKLADGFINLRDAVPHCRGDKKMSKLDTLRNALNYMHYLTSIVHEDDLRKNALQAEQFLAVQPVQASQQPGQVRKCNFFSISSDFYSHAL